jgi:hypothetical protein
MRAVGTRPNDGFFFGQPEDADIQKATHKSTEDERNNV